MTGIWPKLPRAHLEFLDRQPAAESGGVSIASERIVESRCLIDGRAAAPIPVAVMRTPGMQIRTVTAHRHRGGAGTVGCEFDGRENHDL